MGHSDYAPQLFLLAHDPAGGRTLIAREALLTGLVAAELAHLVVERRVGIVDERVVATGPAGPPGPEVDDRVLAAVREREGAHPVPVWVESLGGPLHGLIAEDLVAQGVLRRERRRLPTRRGADRFPAVDLLRAGGARLRLDAMIRQPATFTLAAAVNVALLDALGGTRLLESELTGEFLAELHRNLPTPLQTLVAGAAVSVSSVVLR